MRFILSLLAVLALVVAVFAKDDVIDCRKKNRDIEQAINYMCGWTYDLVRREPRNILPFIA